MQPATCPEFEYDNHPDRDRILPAACIQLFSALRRSQIDTRASVIDSRPHHDQLFRDLTPPNYRHYAGHYRGEALPCLEHYAVGIQGDPRVGYQPVRVQGAMGQFAATLAAGIAALDVAYALPNAQLSPEQKLTYIVIFAARVFEEFLRIHPYANGNGHMARFIVIALLGRFGYWMKQWPIDGRPPDPPYSDLIPAYRDGDPEALEKFIFQCLLGTA